MVSIESLNNSQIINIDFPFSQANDYRLDGIPATSFETLREMINRSIELGFDTVSFDTNVPIDAQSGDILEYITIDNYFDGNRDKSFSEEVWRGIEYAESLGLKTVIDLNIRNALNDVFIMSETVGSNFNTNTFFESVKIYETEIAEKAQSYGVDGIVIGAHNHGYMNDEFEEDWQGIVDSIRDVYLGELSYRMNLQSTNIPLWDMIDRIKLDLNPIWELNSDYTAENFVSLYSSPFLYLGGESQTSVDQYITYFIQNYPEKELDLQIRFEPGQSAGNEFANPWSYVFEADPEAENAKTEESLRLFPEGAIDYELNNQKIGGFFEYFGNYLKNDVSSITYWQFMPWTESAAWREPSSFLQEVWQSAIRAGPALNWNPQAQEILSKYLTQPWGFTTLHYGTDGSDFLVGSNADDSFFVSSGDDLFVGGAGLDIAIFDSPRLNVSEASDGLLVGNDTLREIERIEFSDVSLAFDVQGSAGNVSKVLAAVIGEDGLSNKEYVGIGLQLFDAGQSLAAVCELALGAVGATTNEDVVNLLYTNLYGEAPTADVAQPFIDALNNGEYSKGILASAAAELTDDLGVIDLVGLAETGIEYV